MSDKGGPAMAVDSVADAPSMAAPQGGHENYGPWNPGIESALPSQFLPLSTVFSTANVSSSIDELQELIDIKLIRCVCLARLLQLALQQLVHDHTSAKVVIVMVWLCKSQIGKLSIGAISP